MPAPRSSSAPSAPTAVQHAEPRNTHAQDERQVAADNQHSDVGVAVRNGLRLGGSLLATWTVALVVRFQMPRALGPEQFGLYNFCEAFTGGFFSLLSLGVGTYIMKEIPVRPKHASDFFGGLFLVRAVLGVLALSAIALVLHQSQHPDQIRTLALVFGLVHFVIGINTSLATLLQASSNVRALATMNVVAKLVWGGGLIVALICKAPLYVLALPSLVSEVLKTVVLAQVARTAIALEMRVDMVATKAVILASLPFFANAIALELGFRIDVTMLEFMAKGPEVGWYSAANSFASLAMLVSPALGWVVMPLLARASSRSKDEVYEILQVSLRTVLMLIIPVALGLIVMAEFCVELAFGQAFLPAVHAVRLLAPMFIATYVAILLSNTLIVLQRSWVLTTVSFSAVLIEPVVIWLVVPYLRGRGPGYAAAGAAFGLALSELVTVVLLLRAVGMRSFDRSAVSSVVKCLVLSVLVIVMDHALLGLGPLRFLIDGGAYVAGALLSGAVHVTEVSKLIAMLRQRRSAAS